MHERHYNCIFFLTCLQLCFFKCKCFWFWVFCCEISNYFFCDYNHECYCKLDMFLVRETIIVRPFQRNQDCYCGYFIPIAFKQVRFRLRLGCSGSLMSVYGPTFHVTAVDLCIIFQCNLYIISCTMSYGNKFDSNYFKLFQVELNDMRLHPCIQGILNVMRYGKQCICAAQYQYNQIEQHAGRKTYFSQKLESL